MTDATTAQLLPEAERFVATVAEAITKLAEAIKIHDARIAALEAARAPHGPPLEGTGPLPLERKGG